MCQTLYEGFYMHCFVESSQQTYETISIINSTLKTSTQKLEKLSNSSRLGNQEKGTNIARPHN